MEIEGTIINWYIYVLIDPSATLSYVSPKVKENYKLMAKNFKNTYLVEFSMGAKRRVTN